MKTPDVVVPPLRRSDTRRQSRRPVRDEQHDIDEGFEWPESYYDVPLHVLSLPWRYAFYVTIPNCAAQRFENWYPATFVASLSWISVISYLMVSWAARIGCIIGIPQVVMGTLVVAAGTSIPDALGSIAVAKIGEGDMAVANAVGSNVFDIWLGLGLPWLIVLPIKFDGKILLALYYVALLVNRWRLSRLAGVVFLCAYAVFATYCVVFVWLQDIYNLSS